MAKKFIALFLCLAMVAGMTALVSADTIVDPVSVSFEEFFDLTAIGDHYFNVTDDGSAKKIEARNYDGNGASQQFKSVSPDANTTYKIEWEWKTDDPSPVNKIEVGGTGWETFTYNGSTSTNNGTQYANAMVSIPTDGWKKESVTITYGATKHRFRFTFDKNGTIYVKNFKVVKITADTTMFDSFDLSGNDTELTVGDTSDIIVTGLVDGTVLGTVNPEFLSFTSDNEEIATVDANGKITAVKPGISNITVSSLAYGNTATVAVNVEAAASDEPTVIYPDSITFEEFFGMNNQSGFNPYYFNVTDDGSVKKIEATKYDKGQPDSQQFKSVSPDANTTYKIEWEWKAENSSPVSKIELGNTNWTSFTYNGSTSTNNGTQYAGATVSVPTDEWKKESVSFTFGSSVTRFRFTFDKNGTIYVKNFKAVKITADTTMFDSFELSGNTQLTEGETSNITVKGYVNGSAVNVNPEFLSFASDNEEVATVDANGKITAVKPGIANITVSSFVYGISKTIVVNVEAATASVPYVEISKNVSDAGSITGENGVVYDRSYIVYATITNYHNIVNYGMILKSVDGDANIELASHFEDEDVMEALSESNGQFAFKVYGDVFNEGSFTLTPYITTDNGTLTGNESEQFGN